MRRAIAFLVIAAIPAGIARAQEEPGQPRIPSSQPAEEEEAGPLPKQQLPPFDEDSPAIAPLDELLEDSLPPCGPRAEELYEQGFELLAKNERAEAVKRFNEVLEQCPEHPYAAELRRLAAFYPEPPRAPERGRSAPALGPRSGASGGGGGSGAQGAIPRSNRDAASGSASPGGPFSGSDSAPAGRGPSRASLLARAEMITVLSATGLVSGVFACGALDCDDARGYAAAGIAGVALAGGLSLAFSADLTPGQTAAIDSGAWWGLFNALAVPIAVNAKKADAYTLAFAMTLAGTGAGTAAALALRPDAGRVSLANSAGLWSGVITFWLMAAADVKERDGRPLFQVELVTANAGLLLGALSSRFLPPVSRAHMLLIDAGGLVGMLVGVGVAFLVDADPSNQLMGALALTGTLGGLGTVTYLSRKMDEPRDELDVLVRMLPAPRGLAMSVTF